MCQLLSFTSASFYLTSFCCLLYCYICVCLGCQLFFLVCLIKNPPKRCAWRASKTFVYLQQLSLLHPPSIDLRQDLSVLVSIYSLMSILHKSLKTLFLFV